MRRFLLDTNILSDVIRQPHGRVAGRVSALSQDELCTSIIVVAELRVGAIRRETARLAVQLEAVLEGIDVLAFEKPADIAYGKLRAYLEQAGTPVGANDLLIAAHALTLDLTLVTDNEREFSRVPDLKIENWLR
jgi:tRNA(fMet)-specific endonuclease VapC